MGNASRENRLTGSLLNVTLAAICGGDRAKRRIEPVRDFFLSRAHGIATELQRGIVEIERIQDVAQGANAKLEAFFAKDKNRDGVITMAEWMEREAA